MGHYASEINPAGTDRRPSEAEIVTAEYARQIFIAVDQNKGGDGLYLITELLKEYGAKAYRQGREHLAAEVAKLARS